jgi:hypothetical protein
LYLVVYAGGHVGFMDGVTPFSPTYADKAAIKFLSGVLEVHAANNFLLGIYCMRVFIGESILYILIKKLKKILN